MPAYNFTCNDCKEEAVLYLSIIEFLEIKKNLINCSKCINGFLTQKIGKVNSNIELSKDQIILNIQDDVRKTVNKISNGNQKAIEDVYGDRANPYKK